MAHVKSLKSSRSQNRKNPQKPTIERALEMNFPPHINDYLIKTQADIIQFSRSEKGQATKHGAVFALFVATILFIFFLSVK